MNKEFLFLEIFVGIDLKNTDLKMEKFTVEEFQADFDNLLERVENGESFIVTDDGKEAVIIPSEDYDLIVDGLEEQDDLIRIHMDHEEGC